MTRKDYVLIADAINEAAELHQRQYGDRWPLDGRAVVDSIADALAADNPLFRRDRFMLAAGVEE